MVEQSSMRSEAEVCTHSASDAPGLPFPLRRSNALVVTELLDEIELLLDVIDAVSAYPTHLTTEQLDAVLHLPPPLVRWPGMPWKAG